MVNPYCLKDLMVPGLAARIDNITIDIAIIKQRDKLGVLYKSMGKYTKAETLSNQSLAIRKNIFGEEHPNVATSMHTLSMLYLARDKYAEAKPLYEQALAIREKFFEKEHPDFVSSLHTLATVYYLIENKYSEAELLFKQVLEIYEKILGKTHPDIALTMNNFAGLYRAQGKYTEFVKNNWPQSLLDICWRNIILQL